MKAVVYRAYGAPDVLKLENVDTPIPRAGEVVIRVRATTVTAADCMMRRGDTLLSRLVLGLFRPRRRYRVLGIELAGEVVRSGCKVTRFREGDRVFGFAGFSVGAYAQFACMPEHRSLAIMPDGLTFEEAASVVDGATTAMFFLKDKAHIQEGDKVLIIGASGSIGTAAVQLARHAGAEVTAVCSGANAELVRSLGAHRVLDYTTHDFTENGETYDVILDAVGKSSFRRCRDSLAVGGHYLLTVGGVKDYLLTLWTRMFGRKRCTYAISIEKNSALESVKELLESGALHPVIDRCYTLDQIVDAHRYVDQGHKKGNVVVTVPHDSPPRTGLCRLGEG